MIFVDTNVKGTVNLLQCCKEAWYTPATKGWKAGKKYLQVSTDEVYGALGAEGYFTETTPTNPHSPYSASKASADHYVQAFHDTYGMPINITRCSNNYGYAQMLQKVIPLIINNCIRHKPLPVYGDGMQIRDWLYVEDHCKAIIKQLSERLEDSEINEGLIKHVEDRLGHNRRYGIDSRKIKSDLGWYPETPFEVGIVKTIDWYFANTEWMEHATSGDYQKYYNEMYKNRQ